MPKIETLKSNYEFRRAYARGKSYQCPALVMYCNRNRAGICRIGITTSKKIGNAVQRNRARRIIKAAFYSLLPEIEAARAGANTGMDFVFAARTKALSLKSTDIERYMEKLLRSAGKL